VSYRAFPFVLVVPWSCKSGGEVPGHSDGDLSSQCSPGPHPTGSGAWFPRRDVSFGSRIAPLPGALGRRKWTTGPKGGMHGWRARRLLVRKFSPVGNGAWGRVCGSIIPLQRQSSSHSHLSFGLLSSLTPTLIIPSRSRTVPSCVIVQTSCLRPFVESNLWIPNSTLAHPIPIV